MQRNKPAAALSLFICNLFRKRKDCLLLYRWIGGRVRTKSFNALCQRPSQRGKYHCMADLLFDWFGMNQTNKTVVHST